MTDPLLTHALVTAPGATPSSWMLFLHGIFGTGANWRTFARRWTAERPTWGAVLVDLRMHGRSQGFAPPHTVAAAAADLRALEASVPGPVRAVTGHSFGGKVALAYVAARGGDLERAWILDSTPGARIDRHGSETTLHVLEILASLPRELPSREAFQSGLAEKGVEPSIIAWLAMNLGPAPGDGGTYVFRLDLAAIRALLDDYFAQDVWPVIESPPGNVRLGLVIGGRSRVFDEDDRERARRAAAAHPDRVEVHTIADASHWVHVDAPDALLAILLER
ncbi:MAG: putative hydrolase, alpha/beta fold family [Myxococcaceae bacterium]|nr:putative hydrolase, alpha/beta fold family [Myxococcaceae bacterium]